MGWGRGRHFWGKSGTNWGQGQTCCWGILGNFPQKFPKNRGGDGEDIFGEYWGPIGDGDRLKLICCNLIQLLYRRVDGSSYKKSWKEGLKLEFFDKIL